MIGPIETGILEHAEISAVIHEGFTVKTKDGRPCQLAIINDDGKVVESGEGVADETFKVAIAAYKNFAIGKGWIRIISGTVPDNVATTTIYGKKG